ncbi:MAG: NAD(P)-dependent oxidoreductase [Galactobacter sp.]|uniref:NAD(P)-dependent oxidoreductase n=1 Tax=Galactobacter sp. TaxID=2676125 RepID=UPI0025B92609|nr:NAD(P)H-binding protein [Galactobacter sp.]
MKIAVYGATGMVGSEITAEAVKRGHEVTAITRGGTSVEGTTALAADLSDLSTYRDVASKNDVVVLAVPSPRDGSSHDEFRELHEEIAETLIPGRLFVVGGAGATQTPDGTMLKDTPDFPAAYKPEADTFAAVLLDYQSSSGLDWTMLAPAPEIAPGPATAYTLGSNQPAGDFVSAGTFAVAALDEIETPKHKEQRFTVANA